MTKRVDEAIEVLKELPEDQQETVVDAILDYASHDGRYHLCDFERDEVRAGLAEVRMGKLATHADVAESSTSTSV